MQLTELRTKALELQPSERETLAHELLDSLEEESISDISKAWMSEIDQRIKDVDEGRVTMIPCDQFRAELRQKTGW